MRALDARCAKLGIERFGARARELSGADAVGLLARCNYFASFPQTVSMVAHLVEDYDQIEEFRSRQRHHGTHLDVPDWHGVRDARGLPEPRRSATTATRRWRRDKLTADGRCVTARRASCFRYESKNIIGLDRAWDFTMREVIFVGTESWVTDRRQKAIEAVSSSRSPSWDLDCAIETANDPFFPTALRDQDLLAGAHAI